MKKAKTTIGKCPVCNWQGEEREFMHEVVTETPVCPECTSTLQVVEIQSVTVPFGQNEDKPVTESEECW